MAHCSGCSMAEAYQKIIPSKTKSRAVREVGRVLVDMSGPELVPSLAGKTFVMFAKSTLFLFIY